MVIYTVCSWDIRTLRWLDSLRSTGYKGKAIVLVTGQANPAVLGVVAYAYDAQCFHVPGAADAWQTVPKNVWRWGVLDRINAMFPGEYFLHTDCHDVVFLRNPEEVSLDPSKLTLCVENQDVGECPVNMEWLAYGNVDLRPLRAKRPDQRLAVINSGMFAGKFEHIKPIQEEILAWKYKTYFDQSEMMMSIWTHDFPFVHNDALWACLYKYKGLYKEENGKITWQSGKAPCIIHANSVDLKVWMDRIFPPEEYDKILDGIMAQAHVQTGAVAAPPSASGRLTRGFPLPPVWQPRKRDT